MLRRLGPDAVLLSGNWAGGGALVAIDPIVQVADAADPFAGLADLSPQLDAPPGTVGGGWFGWIGFDPARSRFGYYPNLLRYDSATRQWFDEALIGLVADEALEHRRSGLVRRLDQPEPPSTATMGPFRSLTLQAGYEAAVAAGIAHIEAGDIYQVNLCLALEAAVTGSPGELAAQLLHRLRPAYGAYLPGYDVTVLSASPELFLRRSADGRVQSSPIKGTRPRPSDRAGAQAESARLRASAKDRAENVMIVDLVRNDLARVAITGSVSVPDLLRLEPHPGVWHLVSDVTASVRPGTSDAELLRATFPPGSVTGTPKLRAIDIIAELEPVPRGLYTGAIGYQSPVAGLELSVAIRSLEIRGTTARLGVGAGITAGSDPREEWWECFDKAAPIASALGTSIDVAGAGRPQ